MNIEIVQEYARDKLYGKALNKRISRIPEDYWICVMDLDAMFLYPNQPDLMYEAIETHPDTTLFTCSTNRAWGQQVSPEGDITKHIKIAHEKAKERIYKPISGVIPAFFWLFHHKVWRKHPFDDKPIISGDSFDTRWCRTLPGRKMRIEHLYIWHTYRIDKYHRDYKHLK